MKRSIKTLTLVLTTRCNSKCMHCDIWKEENKDMDFTQIKKIIQDPLMANLSHLELSGGEPFLWKEGLTKILTYLSGTTINSIGISSNGMMTEEIIDEISRYSEKEKLILRFSLDGLEEKHDSQRGIKGAFNKTIATAAKIQELFPKIKQEFVFTITKENYIDIEKLQKYLIETMPKSVLTFGLNQYVPEYKTKKKTKSESEINFSEKEISEVKKQLKTIYDEYIKQRFFEEAILINMILNHLKNAGSRLPCLTPMESAIIMPDLSIYPCVMQEKIGVYNGESIESSIDKNLLLKIVENGANKKCPGCVLRIGRYVSLHHFVNAFRNRLKNS